MYCPFCNCTETKVNDSRLVSEGRQVRRRRECLECGERFSTYEIAELVMPQIIKQTGNREPFNENKLRAGIVRALEKRPVSMDAVESMINNLKLRMRATGERELASSLIGEWVMEELKALDQVAYVRFASVYRSFEDIQAFQKEINELTQANHK